MRLGVMSGRRGVHSWRVEMGVLFTRSEWERGMEGVWVRVRGEAEMGSVTRELAGSDAGKVFSGLLGVVFVIGSEEMTCMAPYRRAATSWGERGRDFLLSFCLRFWNQIYKGSCQ